MKKFLSCEFNMDTACVELRYSDGSMISIDTIAVENEIAENMYERSELNYLVYNAPLEYADLILNGDPELYLKTVTEYKPLDNWIHDKRDSNSPSPSVLRNIGSRYRYLSVLQKSGVDRFEPDHFSVTGDACDIFCHKHLP